MKNIVLVPSAKLIPVELQAEFGTITSAMVPIDGRPAIHYIAEKYNAMGYELVIAVDEAASDVVNYIKRSKNRIKANTIRVFQTKSLGETILYSLKSLKELPDRLIINFADTVINDEIEIGNIIYYAKVKDAFRWTTFTFNENNDLLQIKDKGYEKEYSNTGYNVFVGVFSIRDVKQFVIELEKTERNEIDSFYEAIHNYFNKISYNNKQIIATTEWYDFGHLDTYYYTKKSLSKLCRSFNKISVDLNRGIIRKSSLHNYKFLKEINWYLKLPKKLQYIAPRVFYYNNLYENPILEIEYYGYPSLNDLYLYSNLDTGSWLRIFNAIYRIHDEMKSYKCTELKNNSYYDAMKKMYEYKTLERIENYIFEPRYSLFLNKDLKINNKDVFNLKYVKDNLGEILEYAGIYETNEFTIIHGDLCLSNILYDDKNGFIRLIDPRGDFGGYELYGDPLYELCKLNHSLEGDYDFILNGLFNIQAEGANIELDIFIEDRHRKIKKIYKRMLIERIGNKSYWKVKLLESLLFLSMIPLHNDRPYSQLAFIARGLQIFKEVCDYYTEERK